MLRKDVKKRSPATIGTADPAEIARFNALAEEWWNPDGAFKMVHALPAIPSQAGMTSVVRAARARLLAAFAHGRNWHRTSLPLPRRARPLPMDAMSSPLAP